MERRDFFKILSATSATVLATNCGKKQDADALIPLLVPEHEIVPGVEQWHPAVCTECGAGCGTLVRVMEAERVIERNGEKLRERIAAVKKIEGNPLDPVSGGRLCARGQAAVQGLYHPDRLRGPMKRTGGRGTAAFATATWDEAIAAVADRIGKADAARVVVITGAQTGTRSLAWQRFTEALRAHAPVVCSIADFAAERKAAELVFGWKGAPVYDLANAHYALGVGADFLGTWQSPVYYARQFGHFRQGRGEIRGRLVQAESRLSVTASAADQWLPLRPGSEPQFLAALGRVLMDEKLARQPDTLPKPVAAQFAAADVTALAAACALDEKRVRTVARNLGQSDAPLVIAGAPTLHSNSVAAVAAAHYVNLMLGNIGKPGGVLAPVAAIPGFENNDAAAALANAQVVLIDGANPLYTLPWSMGIRDALAHVETVISFAPFLDDSAAWADWLLPDHHALESEIALAPATSARVSVAVATPFVRPLYDTRAVEQTLGNIAAKATAEYHAVTAKDVVTPLLPADTSYDDAARQGGLWLEPPEAPKLQARTWDGPLTPAAEFRGDPAQYPFQFLPYLSVQYFDGRSSHLPWMQELPDPASSAMWGLPVEIDPRSAARLGVATGDRVKIESVHGAIEAPAFVHPGAAPGVLSMAIGDGHTHFGRYASGRGVNPLAILAPVRDAATGALALGATRVRLTRIGDRQNFIQFSAQYREERQRASLMATETPHRWGMAIDLDRCTGCEACVAACHAENNLPLAWPEEAARGRTAHWIRVDRYFEGEFPDIKVKYMPVLCQQCDEAPCEPVCPTYATYHNNEGLNVQVYNRCVGTFYCANNCPYTVRYFNWFEPTWAAPLTLQHNPDVAVRMAGVMEKCTFCIQRIKRVKDDAATEGRRPADGEVQPACVQSCPAEAMVFGDLNDPESKVSRLAGSSRAKRLLEELGTKPKVFYLEKAK